METYSIYCIVYKSRYSLKQKSKHSLYICLSRANTIVRKPQNRFISPQYCEQKQVNPCSANF